MPGSTTVVGGQRALDAITGRAAPAARSMWIALLTAAPTRTTTLATMSEVAVAGYARQAATYSAPTSADPPVTSLTTGLTWGPFTGDPPNVTHAALVSASSGTTGEISEYWTLDAAKDVGVNDSLTAAAGTCSISSTS